MYRCEICKRVVKANTPCEKVVTEKRMFNHPSRPGAFKQWDEEKERWFKIPDPGGVGTQIVKEINACPDCFAASQVEK